MPVESSRPAVPPRTELGRPDLAAILIATEPETRLLDLALADELLASGAGVLAVVAEEDPGLGRRRSSGHSIERLLRPYRSSLANCSRGDWPRPAAASRALSTAPRR